MSCVTISPVNGKSFYGKCSIMDYGDVLILRSYDTLVASYDNTTKKMTIDGWYSQTTAKHINAFLNYFDFDPMTKSEMEKA